MQAFSFDTYDLFITTSKAGDIGSKIDDVSSKVDELQQKIDELNIQVSKLVVKKARKPYVKKELTPEQAAELHAKRVEAGKKGAATKAKNAALKKEKEIEALKKQIRAQVEIEFAMKKQEREVLENM